VAHGNTHTLAKQVEHVRIYPQRDPSSSRCLHRDDVSLPLLSTRRRRADAKAPVWSARVKGGTLNLRESVRGAYAARPDCTTVSFVLLFVPVADS
jgi:hypothetical protein